MWISTHKDSGGNTAIWREEFGLNQVSDREELKTCDICDQSHLLQKLTITTRATHLSSQSPMKTLAGLYFSAMWGSRYVKSWSKGLYWRRKCGGEAAEIITPHLFCIFIFLSPFPPFSVVSFNFLPRFVRHVVVLAVAAGMDVDIQTCVNKIKCNERPDGEWVSAHRVRLPPPAPTTTTTTRKMMMPTIQSGAYLYSTSTHIDINTNINKYK